MKELGLKQKSFQESKREIWNLDGVEIVIDTWPFLDPFVEIEGQSKQDVKKNSSKLEFSWEDTIFGPVTEIYYRKTRFQR